MFGITDIWTYVVGVTLILALPGPNSLCVLTVATRRGVRDGYKAAGGVFLGDTILMLLPIAGVATLMRANPALFSVIKFAGAAYLAWIGLTLLHAAWRGLRSRPGHDAPSPANDPASAEAVRAAESERPFRRALIVSLMNPKGLLFFTSFFVQFVDPAYHSPTLSFLILGAILQVISFVCLSVLIFAGARIARSFRGRRRLSAGVACGAGALFLGFGGKLATTTL